MMGEEMIAVSLFGQEIGRIGYQENEHRSTFQYNPSFLESNSMLNIFPATGIIKRMGFVQLYGQFNGETFKGLPPQFADSLPDLFGSVVFQAWLDGKQQNSISVLEQLAYVGNRGMGALEYSPAVELKQAKIDLDEIVLVVKEVLSAKRSARQEMLDSQALLNIFRIGSSAGGARPKILISENKLDGNVIPGDLEVSNEYNHYLVKLAIDEDVKYPREIVEYCYYRIIRNTGIRMMESKLIDQKHFATLRFDRQDGEKKHILTASGITGWDYKKATNSSYENLFKLSSFLQIPHVQIEELFERMVFNIIYGNVDDHLKNHSFIYNQQTDSWELSPAYDITFALNPLLSFKNTRRALSINGKRSNISLNDVLTISEAYTIKDALGIIGRIESQMEELLTLFEQYHVPKLVAERIHSSCIRLT